MNDPNHSRNLVRSRAGYFLGVFLLASLTSLIATAQAQEVSIPDAGLNQAVRAALQKPAGPLTAQDMLSLTNLNATGRCIEWEWYRDGAYCVAWRTVSSLAGLEAAHNLATLNLGGNHLTNFSALSGLT